MLKDKTEKIDEDDDLLAEFATALNVHIIEFSATNNLPKQKSLYKFYSKMWKPAPFTTAMLGAFNHSEFLGKENIVVVKPVKEKTPRRKRFDPDSVVATQTQVNITSPNKGSKKGGGKSKSLKDIRKNLIDFAAESGKESANIHEFTVNKESVMETIRNVLDVAHGIRDGSIGLNMEGTKNEEIANNSIVSEYLKKNFNFQQINNS